MKMTCNKYIKLFEEEMARKNAFSNLLKLKEVATKAASSHSFESGAMMIQDFLNQNADEIKSEMEMLPELGIRNLQFSIYELMYPYYNRWGGDILDSVSTPFKQEDSLEIEDLPSDTDSEDDIELEDF